MSRENDTRPKPDEKPAARLQRKALRCVPGRQETCVVGFCAVLLTGCTGTPQVVRPPPRPADCPPGAVKTMKELGIDIGEVGAADFGDPDKPEGRILKTVRESTPMLVAGLEGLGNFEITGRLYLGPERVYGRFTQARGLRSGKTYPVCLELVARDEKTLGAPREDVGGPADSAVVITTQAVRAVERFE
jgi:serine/threonine-protein kinase